jgi:Ca-activated chloride channel family protein
MRYICLLILVLIALNLQARVSFNYKRFWKDREGRKNYQNENFEKAEKHFRENAIENPNVGQFHFNRGTALYKNEAWDEAAYEFQLALNDRNFADKDQIFHNLGNVSFQKEEYAQALDYFRRSLIENPNNIDSRKNWELTRLMIQQNESESDNDENEDDQDQDQQDQSTASSQQTEQQQQEQLENERLLQAIEQKQEQEKEEEKSTGVRRGNYW